MGKKKKKSVSVYLDGDVIDLLEARAEEVGISVSSLCRGIIVKEVRGAREVKEVEACPDCGKDTNYRDEMGQQVYYRFPNGIWRCTSCGGEGRWRDA